MGADNYNLTDNYHACIFFGSGGDLKYSLVDSFNSFVDYATGLN